MKITQYLCPYCKHPMTVKLGGEDMKKFKGSYRLVQYRHAFCETCKKPKMIKYFPYSRCHFPSEVQARDILSG